MKRFIFLVFTVLLGISICEGVVNDVIADDSTNKGYKITSVTYELTDNNQLEGNVRHNLEGKRKVFFTIKNIGKKHLNFKEASYFAVTYDEEKYLLDVIDYVNNTTTKKDLILNPKQELLVQCVIPQELEMLDGFYIALKDSSKIYFEYEELTNVKTLLRKSKEFIAGKKFECEDGSNKHITSSGSEFCVEELD